MSQTVAKEDRCIKRRSVMQCYFDHMFKYLRTLYPKIPDDRIREFIYKTIDDRLVRPQADILVYPSYGNVERKQVDLLTFIKQYRNKIIAPSGTIFESTDIKVATDKQFIDQLCADRKVHKNLMFDYTVAGNHILAALEDYKQALCKIKVNSIIGSNGNEQNALYDLESFNSTTSLARHGVIMAYAFTEKFLVNNQYFPTVEKLINFIILTAHKAPSKEIIDNLVNKYCLISPTAYEVSDSLMVSMQPYVYHYEKYKRQVEELLLQLPQHELTYIYYSRNLYNLFTANTSVFRRWIDDFTRTDVNKSEVDDTINPKDIKKIDDDLQCVISTVFNKELDNDILGELPKINEDKARAFVVLGKKLQKKLDDLSDLLNVFIYGTEFIQDIPCHRLIKRKAVAISDTDSVIFTTKHLTSWYLGRDVEICQDAFNVHAIIIYLMTKSLAKLIEIMSISRGATGDNIKKINMKNEFLYSVLIRTLLGKHYLGRQIIREGRVLKKPVLDIKGVSFKSSNVPQCTHEYFERMANTLIDDVTTHTKVHLSKYISMALDYEILLYNALKQGDLSFYNNISIKAKDEYKKPETSIYINYEFWEAVFAEKYDSIHIPGKYTLVPLKNKSFRDEKYQDFLQMKDPEIYRKLMNHLATLDPKKKITRIPIAATLTKIPDIIAPLVDIRSIMYKNTAPIQLLLRSLGADLGNSKQKPLFSDMYPVLDESV